MLGTLAPSDVRRSSGTLARLVCGRGSVALALAMAALALGSVVLALVWVVLALVWVALALGSVVLAPFWVALPLESMALASTLEWVPLALNDCGDGVGETAAGPVDGRRKAAPQRTVVDWMRSLVGGSGGVRGAMRYAGTMSVGVGLVLVRKRLTGSVAEARMSR